MSNIVPGHENCSRCLAPEACPTCLEGSGYCRECQAHDEALAGETRSKLQERIGPDSNGCTIWFNHTGCPDVIPDLGGVWPRMKALKAFHHEWQDTYECPLCGLRVVVTLVKE